MSTCREREDEKKGRQEKKGERKKEAIPPLLRPSELLRCCSGALLFLLFLSVNVIISNARAGRMRLGADHR